MFNMFVSIKYSYHKMSIVTILPQAKHRKNKEHDIIGRQAFPFEVVPFVEGIVSTCSGVSS